MEIAKIDEAGQTTVSRNLNLRRSKGKACIYFPNRICAAPRLQFKICRICPRAAQFIRQNVVKSIFAKIKALAIMLMNTMGVGVSKGGNGGSSGGGGI